MVDPSEIVSIQFAYKQFEKYQILLKIKKKSLKIEKYTKIVDFDHSKSDFITKQQLKLKTEIAKLVDKYN